MACCRSRKTVPFAEWLIERFARDDDVVAADLAAEAKAQGCHPDTATTFLSEAEARGLLLRVTMRGYTVGGTVLVANRNGDTPRRDALLARAAGVLLNREPGAPRDRAYAIIQHARRAGVMPKTPGIPTPRNPAPSGQRVSLEDEPAAKAARPKPRTASDAGLPLGATGAAAPGTELQDNPLAPATPPPGPPPRPAPAGQESGLQRAIAIEVAASPKPIDPDLPPLSDGEAIERLLDVETMGDPAARAELEQRAGGMGRLAILAGGWAVYSDLGLKASAMLAGHTSRHPLQLARRQPARPAEPDADEVGGDDFRPIGPALRVVMGAAVQEHGGSEKSAGFDDFRPDPGLKLDKLADSPPPLATAPPVPRPTAPRGCR